MGTRQKLDELEPEWLDDRGVERAGLVFTCPVHGPPCRLSAWLKQPGGGGLAVTETAARPLHQHEGDFWDELSLFPPIRHVEWLVFCFEGEVVAG